MPSGLDYVMHIIYGSYMCLQLNELFLLHRKNCLIDYARTAGERSKGHGVTHRDD